MDVREIVEKYLKKNKYDGLFNADGGCACLTSDLAPCGEIYGECEAGHLKPCDCGEHDWHIGLKLPVGRVKWWARVWDWIWAVLEATSKNGNCKILKRKGIRRGAAS